MKPIAYPRWDSNPQALRRLILSQLRLPIPPRGQVLQFATATSNGSWGITVHADSHDARTSHYRPKTLCHIGRIGTGADLHVPHFSSSCAQPTPRHPARSPPPVILRAAHPPVILRAAKRSRRIQTSVAVDAATDAQHDERVCAYDGWGYLVNLNHVA